VRHQLIDFIMIILMSHRSYLCVIRVLARTYTEYIGRQRQSIWIP